MNRKLRKVVLWATGLSLLAWLFVYEAYVMALWIVLGAKNASF